MRVNPTSGAPSSTFCINPLKGLTSTSRRLFGEVQVVAEPLATNDLLDGEARVTVCQRQEEVPAGNGNSQNNTTGDPGGEKALASKTLAGADVPLRSIALLVALDDLVALLRSGLGGEDELQKSTRNKAGSQVCREVVVEEELTTHEVEGEVVSGPGQEEETG